MTLPIDRSPTDPADDPDEHAADHNTLAAFYNDHPADPAAHAGYVAGAGIATLTVATSAPSTPATNDIWVDSDADSTLEHTHPAGDFSFTPTGTIAATNVQDAIAEVAAEAGGGSDMTFARFAFR
jgi:hypothetical protein